MIFINLLVYLLIISGIIYFLLRSLPFFRQIDRNRHPLKLLYPLSFFIYKRLITINGAGNKKQKELFQHIYINENSESYYILYQCEKISMVLVIVLAFNGAILISSIQANSYNVLTDGYLLDRPGYGEGEKKVDLIIGIQDEEEFLEHDLSLNIGEQRYGEKKLEEMIEYAKGYIDEYILGENESFETIRKPLILMRTIPGTALKVKWNTDNIDLIDTNGRIYNEDMNEKGVVCNIKAEISYFDSVTVYSLAVKVLPKSFTKSEMIIKALEDLVYRYSMDNLEEEQQQLPKDLNGLKLSYKETKDNSSMMLVLLGLITAFGIYVLKDKEVVKQMNKRNMELLLDYPEIVNKLVLLLGAGLTMKGSWGRIVQEYIVRKDNNLCKKRYVYEEMITAWNELLNGRSEYEVYMSFGRRINLMPYIKLSSYMEQNLKKGTRGLIILLEQEAREAFEERKELAKRLGEEAGTKLLAPMMIILVLVLMVIIVPAFLSL